MSTQDQVYSLGATKVIVPVGATVSVLVTPQAYESSTVIRYGTGGSLELVGIPVGASTLTGASLVAAQGNAYLFGSSEVLSIGGAARYYLMATGATVTCYLLKGLTGV